jgi:DNA-binding MarR family transcriptional regulator
MSDDQPASVGEPAQSLGYLLARAAKLIQMRWDGFLRQQGINAGQFGALAFLARSPGLSGAELARRSMVTPQSMSDSLRRLTESGLVAATSSAPGCSSRLEVTPKGRQLLRRLAPAVRELEATAFEQLTDKERVLLAKLLGKLVPDTRSL